MILLLGESGYLGSAFAKELDKRHLSWRTLPRKVYTDWCLFNSKLTEDYVELVINCAAFIPKPSVSLCDHHPAETIQGNVLLPSMLAKACQLHDIPLAHISTGCLWSDGKEHVEDDPPQRGFGGWCGFYVGTKLLAEEEVRKHPMHYIWRVRLPFDEFDNERNYLSKLARFDTVYDQRNSISHRGDFVKACLDLWELKAKWGTYNVVNQGSIKAIGIVEHMAILGIVSKMPTVNPSYTGECRLNVDKLIAAGVKMRTAQEAVDESLNNWKPEK